MNPAMPLCLNIKTRSPAPLPLQMLHQSLN